jgi:hypothetical protein
LVLLGLGAFAVSLPLLSDLRAGAGYFVARRAEPWDILLLVLMITFLPGIAANVLVWIAHHISRRLGLLTESAVVGFFFALLARTLLLRISTVLWGALLVPVVVGTFAAVTYFRTDWVRDGLAWLVPVPLIAASFFLLTAPMVHLISPQRVAAVDVEIGEAAPVVFIVFDELPLVSLLDRAGELDAVRYPNFAKLAEMSTWYKYTATAHDGTLWAVPALLTGNPPQQSLVPTAANYPGNLFTLLHGSHELQVLESHTFLCPPEMCLEPQRPLRFGQRLGLLIADSARLYSAMITPDPSDPASASIAFNESLASAEAEAANDPIVDRAASFEGFLTGITSEDRHLYYAHLDLPHIPYEYYSSGSRYLGGGRLDGQAGEVWFEQTLAEQAYQRHLLQVEFVDRLLGRLLARLERTGILDEALVVITADHGASFRVDASRRAMSPENAYEIGLVPLFIKAPHQSKGLVETTPARTIDVLPTMATYLGIELPWLHDGRSLTGESVGQLPLRVKPHGGEIVELHDVEEGVLDATEYAYSIFGDGRGRVDPYALGDYDRLLDLDPEEISSGSSDLQLRVEDSWRFDHVAQSAGFVPGFLRGEVTSEVPVDTDIAIALNGRIRAVVPIMSDDDQRQFSAILPEAAFVSGFNELEFMAVTGSEQSPTVERVEFDEQHEYLLETGNTGEVERVVDSEGGVWEFAKEPVIDGHVEATNWYPNEAVSSNTDLVIGGWAVNSAILRPAERLVFFVDGVFAGSVQPSIDRPDIVAGYEDSGVLVSGFRGRVSHFIQAGSCQLRAFALSEGTALELEVSERARSTFLGC